MFLYLQCTHPITGEPTARYHCRGEVGEGQARGFIAQMARRGLHAFESPDYLGDAIRNDRGDLVEANPRARQASPGTTPRPAQASFKPGR